jgi:hypothetical protein
MIPFILAAVGGYLIGDGCECGEKIRYEKGGVTIPKKGMYVILESVPNIDYDDYHEVDKEIKAHAILVKDIPNATREVLNFTKQNDLGSGNWAGGDVYKDGVKIGWITYNGRFWENN